MSNRCSTAVGINGLVERDGEKRAVWLIVSLLSFSSPTRLQQAEVVDDLDVDYTQAKIPPHLEPRNIRKIKETTAGMQLDVRLLPS